MSNELTLGESELIDKAIVWWLNLTRSDKLIISNMYGQIIDDNSNLRPSKVLGSGNKQVARLYLYWNDGNPKCGKGFMGRCCCNCKNQLVITKHPWNKSRRFKGNISEHTGLYVCQVFNDMDQSEKRACALENKHGSCELHIYQKKEGREL